MARFWGPLAGLDAVGQTGNILVQDSGVCDSNGSQHQTRFRRFLGRAGLSSAPNWAHFLHFLDGPCFCL